MDLGTFSISLNVKDIVASRAFYERLTFRVIDGNQAEGWLVMQSGEAIIGLFQEKFDRNLLTFHPTDVRAIQAHLKRQGITLTQEAEPGDGPAHVTLIDPDGNPILLDQHATDYEPSGDTIQED